MEIKANKVLMIVLINVVLSILNLFLVKDVQYGAIGNTFGYLLLTMALNFALYQSIKNKKIEHRGGIIYTLQDNPRKYYFWLIVYLVINMLISIGLVTQWFE